MPINSETHAINERDHGLRASAQLKITQAIAILTSAEHDLGLTGWLLTHEISRAKLILTKNHDALTLNLRQIGLLLDKFDAQSLKNNGR